AKSENVFKKKEKNTDEKGTIWELGEEVKKEKDFMRAIKIKISAVRVWHSKILLRFRDQQIILCIICISCIFRIVCISCFFSLFIIFILLFIFCLFLLLIIF